MENRYYKIYLYGIFFILVLPWVNIQPLFSPPAWGKTILFRMVFSFLLFLFLKQIISQEVKLNFSKIFRNTFFWLLAGLTFFYTLSIIFSENSHFSLWGSPLRGGGGLNFIFYILFAIFSFLILKKSDWIKALDLSLLTGAVISLTAIFQKFSLFKEVFLPRPERVVSTLGSSVLLALYLLLLIFIALSLVLKFKTKKRIFYYSCLVLFILALFLTGSRGGLIGLLVGLGFFFFFYPQKSKKLKIVKISFLLALILIFLVTIWIGNQSRVVEYFKTNQLTKIYFERIWNTVYPIVTEGKITVMQDRVTVWKIGWEATKDHPVLGYGPENFSIPFDRYFHPALPGMDPTRLQWWDRAHNFIFDMSSTVGIPALLLYLSIFFLIFWKLRNKTENPILKHGIQATFLAYFTADFFNFDCFSTYLLSFFLLAFSFSLISNKEDFLKSSTEKPEESNPFKSVALVLIFLFLVSFLWYGNLKPLLLNKEMNVAAHQAKKGSCQEALTRAGKTNLSESVITNYLKLQHVDIINTCSARNPQARLFLTEKGRELLKESIQLRPEYTRSYWTLNSYGNYLMASGIESTELEEETIFYCHRTLELSPNHIRVLRDCAQTYILLEDYEKALEMANRCVDLLPLNPKGARECWWKRGVINIASGNIEEGEKDIEIALEGNFLHLEEVSPLYQLMNVYKKHYLEEKDPYFKEKINWLAEEVLKIRPDLEENINLFLDSLE